jgi:hypothetical protein
MPIRQKALKLPKKERKSLNFAQDMSKPLSKPDIVVSNTKRRWLMIESVNFSGDSTRGVKQKKPEVDGKLIIAG